MIKIEDIAKTCHEANKCLCESVGDMSQSNWNNAEQWQRDSAIAGVLYFIENQDSPDSSQHDAWCKDKFNDGWIYGKVKDGVEKTHPCLVDFHELPLYQQAKDTLFKAVCKTMVPLL